MTTYFNTYAFHDAKGRRLAVFCRFLEPETCKAEIFTLACSKKDQFSKRKARQVYDAYLNIVKGRELTYAPINPKIAIGETQEVFKPKIVHVDIKPESRQLQTLMHYCEQNYYWEVSYPVEKEETTVIKVSDILPQINRNA